MIHLPNEVRNNNKLNNAVDNPNGPALHNHRFSSFIGKEVLYT